MPESPVKATGESSELRSDETRKCRTLMKQRIPLRVEHIEMLKLFRRTGPHNPIGISPDCKVSLSRDGAVFLHTARGIVYTSNGVGARIWRGLQDRQSVDEISVEIGRDYGVPGERVRQDAVHFLAELESQGFLSCGTDR
jgi:hypothetical protein